MLYGTTLHWAPVSTLDFIYLLLTVILVNKWSVHSFVAETWCMYSSVTLGF